MTEKQFTFEFDGGAWGVPVFYNNNKKLSFDEVVELLNKLNDENEQLKSELISKDDLIQQLKIKLNMDYYNEWKKCNLKYNEICEELLEENKLYKKLSDENEQLKHDATVLIQANQDYRKENEQLKNLCKTLIKHIEKKSIAFIIDDEVRELLE